MEVTILEALEGWDHYVELPAKEATARFVELLGRDEVRTMALARASDTEPAKVRERLRALLHIGGWHAAAQRVSRAVDERTREKALKVLGSYAT